MGIVRSGDDIFNCNYWSVGNGYQRSRFSRQTIEFLARYSVLPKYGFPVDVIELIPNKDDMYGKNVDLSRDLRIGLFEYAPQQSVVADKRLYQSSNLIGVQSKNDTPTQNVYRCEKCNHISLGEMAKCELCQSDDCKQFSVVQPDFFNANTSVADMSRILQTSKGSRQTAFAPVKNDKDRYTVSLSQIETAIPIEAKMYLFNHGVSFAGFNNLRINNHPLNSTVSLMHTFRTDVIYWIPCSTFFIPGNVFKVNNSEDPECAKRRILAMKGTLNAILRAIPHVLGIAPKEVDGLLYPMSGLGTAFVLFDDVSGGVGHVQQLRMNTKDDHTAEKLIRKVLEKAVSLLEQCTCSFVEEASFYPVSREDFYIAKIKDGIRERKSCIKCLWKQNRPEENRLLDSADAKRVLFFLLNKQDFF